MPDEAEDAVCSGCQTQLTRRYKCAACRHVFYCSAACQRAHWTKGHKKECKAKAREMFWRLKLGIYQHQQGKGPGLTLEQAEDLVGLTWGHKDEFHPEDHLQALTRLRDAAQKCKVGKYAHSAAYVQLMIRGLRAYPITPALKPKEVEYRLVVMGCMYSLSPGDDKKMDHEAFALAIEHARVVEDTLRFRGYASLAYVLHAGVLARKAMAVEAHEEKLALAKNVDRLGREALKTLSDFHNPNRDMVCMETTMYRMALFYLGRLELYGLQLDYLQLLVDRPWVRREVCLFGMVDALIWLRRFSEAERHLRAVKKDKIMGKQMRACAELRLAVIAWEKRDYAECLRLAASAQKTRLGDYAQRNAMLLVEVARSFVRHSSGDGIDQEALEALSDMPSGEVHDASTFARQEQHASLYRCLSAELVFITVLSAPTPLDIDAEEAQDIYRTVLEELEREPALLWSVHYHRIHEAVLKRLLTDEEEAQRLETKVRDKAQLVADVLAELLPREPSWRRKGARQQKMKTDGDGGRVVVSTDVPGGEKGGGKDEEKATAAPDDRDDGAIECYGCCEDFEDTCTVHCGHVFHSVCLDRWVTMCRDKKFPPTCPAFRQDLYV